MKTKFIFIVSALFFTLLCNAQTVYLYTPNGSQVYAFQRSEMSASDISYYTNSYANTYPQATVLSNASELYNCHSYAWNIVEGGPTCWLNQDPDLHKYWDDDSYQQTVENLGEKIFYYNGDHSAIKSQTHTGMYESKWGSMPLMRHAPDYGPTIYDMQYRRYYKKSPPISGPSTICTTPATYTLSAGSASSWGVTPTSAFSLTSTYTASAVVKPLQLSGQAGTLTALVNGVAVTKAFTACSVTISGPDTVCAANAGYSLPAGAVAILRRQPAAPSGRRFFYPSPSGGCAPIVLRRAARPVIRLLFRYFDRRVFANNDFVFRAVAQPPNILTVGNQNGDSY
jgi:hypothetical protein